MSAGAGALVKKRALTRKAGQRLQLEMAHNCIAAPSAFICPARLLFRRLLRQ